MPDARKLIAELDAAERKLQKWGKSLTPRMLTKLEREFLDISLSAARPLLDLLNDCRDFIQHHHQHPFPSRGCEGPDNCATAALLARLPATAGPRPAKET